jgi:phage gpG-like protein
MIRGTVTNNTKLPKSGTFESALAKTISALTFRLLGMVKQDKLSGDPLNRKSGRLSRSVNAKFEDAGKTGVVGTNVIYGAVHEKGGAVSIPAHMRKMKQAFGRPVAVPRDIAVSAHTANFPKRSFLASALRELEPQIKPAIQAAVRDVIKV